MANINIFLGAGNLTRDVELRTTPKGSAVAGFGLAINRSWKDDGGNVQEDVTFLDVECWGRTADNVAKYMRKGDPVMVEGRLKLDQWEDRDTGAKRSRIKVVAERVHFMPKGARGESRDADTDSPVVQPPKKPNYTTPPPAADEDVPF